MKKTDTKDVGDIDALTDASFLSEEDQQGLLDMTSTWDRGSTRRMSLTALEDEDTHKSTKYSGRINIWPGLFLLIILSLVSIALVTYYGNETYRSVLDLNRGQMLKRAEKRRIDDGTTGGEEDEGHIEDIEDLIEEDGTVGNPSEYPANTCILPNYLSRGGQLVVQDKTSGTETPIFIKGINWFGMETGHNIPFGLWDNFQNGTTAYEIAAFLARNKFNSVRLPISVTGVLTNAAPDRRLINMKTNRAIPSDTYFGMIKGIVRALAFRRITVLISIHTLTATDNGPLWYSDQVPLSDVYKAYDLLTEELCKDDYWNILGLDLKNEPHQGTWGDNSATDFRKGASDLGRRMLKGCPNWLAFVEGINTAHEVNIDGESISYFDWWGAGLQLAHEKPVDVGTADKIVYAPHYYNPSVYPQAYMYGTGGTSSGSGMIRNYVELDDATLKARVVGTATDAFGYLAEVQDAAIIMGEFGGIYERDAHPEFTSQRVVDDMIALMKTKGFAGGYVWSLNPEGAFEFNPADKIGFFTEGILKDNWQEVNKAYLFALRVLDDMDDLQKFPCIEK